MDGIQGAALSIKLRLLADGNEKRRQHAARYSRVLSEIEDIALPITAAYSKPVFHIYAIRTQRRDDLMRHLTAQGIGCGIHYPIPVHLQDAYKSLGIGRGSFPVSERCADEFVSLPMFPELEPAQIDYVAQQVIAWSRNTVTA
jgi:dTDP-4-amino-4,6-dideoxygalactose transaminase